MPSLTILLLFQENRIILNDVWIVVLDNMLTAICDFNPLMTNGLAYCYQLGESIVLFREIRSDFEYLFTFMMKFL